MNIVSTGLIADGTSDRALIPLLKLLLDEHLSIPYEEPQCIPWDENDLQAKIHKGLSKFTVDILFVHRDAENQDWEIRKQEICDAIPLGFSDKVICVVPVKMTEAWLLTDANAIRHAVNPSSTADLGLPKLKNIESCAAKVILLDALTKASELGASRRRKFKPEQYRHRVAELTTDLVSLRKIPSFKRLEDELIPLLLKLNQAAVKTTRSSHA